MKISGIGLGLSVVLVAFASAAAVFGGRYAERASASYSPKAIAAAAQVRVNGSQARVPPPPLRLTGEVIELAPGAPLTVTVTVGTTRHQATITGSTYSASIGRPNSDQMVTVEARSTRVHYRTVVGSAGRVRTLAGGDAHLTLSEQPSLRLSPYSTALQWLVRHALGDRDAANDAEFERMTRVAAADDLGSSAFFLAEFAKGQVTLPEELAGYADGYQLLRNREAFNRFATGRGFREGGAIYLYQQAHEQPLALSEPVTDPLVFVEGLPHNQFHGSPGNVFYLGRRADGKFDFDERLPLSNTAGTLSVDAQGRIRLAPFGSQVRVVSKLVDVGNGYMVERNFNRSAAGRTLKRLSRGTATSVWVLRSVWHDRDPVDPAAPVVEEVDYIALSSTSLGTGVAANGWAAIAGSNVALPWMCGSFVAQEELIYDFSRCEYVEHRFDVGGAGRTLDHGWKVDPNAMTPRAPRSHSFNWTLGLQGALDLTDGNVATTFWRLADYPADIGPVFYRSKSLTGTWSGKTMVGIDMAARKSMASWAPAGAIGNWKSPQSTYLPNWYTNPDYETVTQRLAGGTGQSAFASNNPDPLWWQATGNAIYDKRTRVFYPPPRGERPPVVENCATAVSNGASTCNTYVYYFKPVARAGNRYYGIADTYRRDFYAAGQGFPAESSNVRTQSALIYYDCTGGDCLTAATPAAQGPRVVPSAGRRDQPAVRAATPPRGQRMPVRHN